MASQLQFHPELPCCTYPTALQVSRVTTFTQFLEEWRPHCVCVHVCMWRMYLLVYIVWHMYLLVCGCCVCVYVCQCVTLNGFPSLVSIFTLFIIIIITIIIIKLYVWVSAHECRCSQRPEESDPLELKIQATVSCMMGLPAIEVGSSGGALHTLTLMCLPSPIPHPHAPSFTFYCSECLI